MVWEEIMSLEVCSACYGPTFGCLGFAGFVHRYDYHIVTSLDILSEFMITSTDLEVHAYTTVLETARTTTLIRSGPKIYI